MSEAAEEEEEEDDESDMKFVQAAMIVCFTVCWPQNPRLVRIPNKSRQIL